MLAPVKPRICISWPAGHPFVSWTTSPATSPCPALKVAALLEVVTVPVAPGTASVSPPHQSIVGQAQLPGCEASTGNGSPYEVGIRLAVENFPVAVSVPQVIW